MGVKRFDGCAPVCIFFFKKKIDLQTLYKYLTFLWSNAIDLNLCV